MYHPEWLSFSVTKRPKSRIIMPMNLVTFFSPLQVLYCYTVILIKQYFPSSICIKMIYAVRASSSLPMALIESIQLFL